MPYSPCLFVLAVNELSTNLQTNMEINNIHGVTLGPNSPHIHSFLFANDLILCGQATYTEAANIKSVLQAFCAASGQTPNLAKSSILFSKNVDHQSKQAVKKYFSCFRPSAQRYSSWSPTYLQT